MPVIHCLGSSTPGKLLCSGQLLHHQDPALYVAMCNFALVIYVPLEMRERKFPC